MEYKVLAAEIIELIGSKDNVASVFNCATRLRFKLKDDSLVQKEELEKLEGVKGTVTGAGQFQIIIGSKVPILCEEVKKLLDLSDTVVETKKMNPLDMAIDTISSIFSPMLLVMCGAGVLKGFISLLEYFAILDVTSGAYILLYAASDAVFNFLPFILAVTAAEKFKANKFLSLIIAGSMFYPSITALTDTDLSFFGLTFTVSSFASSVLPIIFTVYLQSKLEKVLNRIIPEFVYPFLMPFICLLVLVPIVFIVIGPIFAEVSSWMSTIFSNLYSFSPILLGVVLGFSWNFMVIFGVHWGVVPVILTNLAVLGYDMIIPMVGPINFCMAGAAFGVFLKTKKANVRAAAGTGALTAAFGITEPSIYGTNLKYKRPMVLGGIAGAVGASITCLGGAQGTAVVIPSILTFTAFMNDKGFEFLLIGTAVAFVLAAVLVYFFGYNDSME